MGRRRRRVWRWVLAVTIVLAVALGVLALVIFRLSLQQPAWWVPLDPSGERVRDTAERVENIVTSELHRADRAGVRADDGSWASEAWHLTLTSEQASSWLSVRLPRWLENQTERFHWPEEIRSVQVDFAPGSLRVGAHLLLGDRERTIWGELIPTTDDDGALRVRCRWLHIGRLPVPAALVLDHPEWLGEDHARVDELRRVLDVLSGREPLVREPVIDLSDGRRVRIVAIELGGGTLNLTLRTVFGGN